MKMEEWTMIDFDHLELEDVTASEKARVKQHVLHKKRKRPIWRTVAIASSIVLAINLIPAIAFPSFASQLPFMSDVFRYFEQSDDRNEKFETYSTSVDDVQSSNGLTLMIDRAVYDGSAITVSYAIETEHPLGEGTSIIPRQQFDIDGAIGGSETSELQKLTDTRYVGMSTITPSFKKSMLPNQVHVSWSPKAFLNEMTNLTIEGDWSFAFTLSRLDQQIQSIHASTTDGTHTVHVKSIETTAYSTTIRYDQVISSKHDSDAKDMVPVFRITDDLGHLYVEGLGGGGRLEHDRLVFSGSTTFHALDPSARRLTIEPSISDESLFEPIVIDLVR